MKHAHTCVVSASKSGKVSPSKSATEGLEDMAILEQEDGVVDLDCWRAKRNDRVASVDLLENPASMTKWSRGVPSPY